MGKPLKIEDLSREELIEVITESAARFVIKDRDIRMARFKVMVRKADVLAARAMEELEQSKGLEKYPQWKKASRKFDRAMRMSDRAVRILDGDKS